MPRRKGSGIPAKGPGWGGPARGASTSRIKPGDPDGISALSRDPAYMADKAKVAERMRGVLHDIAIGSDNEHARVAAAAKLLENIDKRESRFTATAGGGVIRVEIVDEGSPSPADGSEAA